MKKLVCWRCGASLDAIAKPISRLAECEQCEADLHVCRLCSFYNPRVSQACDEPIADPVVDKERANFCHYFKPAANAYNPNERQSEQTAKAQLDALFGLADPGGDRLDSEAAEMEQARARLDQLFDLQKSLK